MPRIYSLLIDSAGSLLAPLLTIRTRNDLLFSEGRRGRYEQMRSTSTGPRIWIHAASVGEVTGALPIIQRLHGRLQPCCILLTVSTPQGFQFARARLPHWAEVLPFPCDSASALTGALDSIRPDLFVALESEYWPNLYRFLHQRRVPTLLLNGRLSSRSARLYRLMGPVFEPIFKRFRWLAMHAEEDLQNALSLGARPERSLVLGSSKYEGMLDRTDPRVVQKWTETLRVPSEATVLVGGSLRRRECIDLMEVYARLRQSKPELMAIFAPRHLERLPKMIHWLKSKRIEFDLLTHLENGSGVRHAPVILVDRMGALFDLYALGDLVFCGGTLAPIGGHNILEPAAWEKAVFYGPHLKKVRHEHRILHNRGGSFLVRDKKHLYQSWSHWMQNPLGLREHGVNARLALEQLGEIAARQVELIVSTLAEETGLPGVALIGNEKGRNEWHGNTAPT